MLDLAFRPDPTHRDPVYRQLADRIAELIAAGRIARGERVPPSRELAAALGLARNTVTRAYDALIEAGWLAAHVGRGTFVAGPPPRRAPAATQPLAVVAPGFAWPALLAARTKALPLPRNLAAPRPDAIRFELRAGHSEVSTLPVSELQGAWQRAIARLREHGNAFDPLGWPPLRAAIARGLAGRGIAKSADEVLVTAGAQQAIDLVARALVEPGDVVAVEDPGYPLAALAFRAAGAALVGVGVDDEGLRVDELARVLRSRRVKLVYVTPSVQLPTGVTLSPARREALLALSDRAQMPILEDDYECELRGGAPAAPALAAQAANDRVIYVGTFSKALFPGLRVGYVVGAPVLLRALALVRLGATQQPALLDQMALAELLGRDTLERHVRRVRKRLGERARVMAAALRAHMPEGTRVREPAGGAACWVELPRAVDADALAVAAAARGIAYAGGDAFRIEQDGPPALFLSYAATAPDAIEQAVAELGALAREQIARRAPAARRRNP